MREQEKSPMMTMLEKSGRTERSLKDRSTPPFTSMVPSSWGQVLNPCRRHHSSAVGMASPPSTVSSITHPLAHRPQITPVFKGLYQKPRYYVKSKMGFGGQEAGARQATQSLLI